MDPLLDEELMDEEDPATGDLQPAPPLPPALPNKGQALPATQQPVDDDVLRRYFQRQQTQSDSLNRAEDTAGKSRLSAQLGAAGNTIGNALAGVRQDNSAFDALQKSAEKPVEQVKDQAKLQGATDKIVGDYLRQKYKLGQMADLRNADRTSKEKIASEALKTRADIAGQNSKNYNSRTGAIQKLGEGRLAIAGQGLGLRQGAQAAQAAKTISDDDVVKQSTKQLAQADKGLGRINDIRSGKTPFTTTIKADLEKDAANMLSGGTASSLGQVSRVEFNSYSSEFQHALDKVLGYQGDINSPDYLNQLESLFKGMKKDMQTNMAVAAKRKLEQNKTAFSQNPLAAKALEDAAKVYTGPADEAAAKTAAAPKTVVKKQFSPSRNQTKITYSDGSEEVVDGAQK